MSERPNDGPDGPIDETGIDAGAPDDEAPSDFEAGEAGGEPAGGATDETEWTADDLEGEAPVEGAAASGGPAVDRRPMRPAERRAMRSGIEHGFVVDPSLRITDRASQLFVLLVVGVFVAIFLNGIVLGRGGLLTPIPTASPVPVVTAAPSESPGASGSAAPTNSPVASVSPSATPAPSATPVPSVTPAPSAAPSATPAPSPSAS